MDFTDRFTSTLEAARGYREPGMHVDAWDELEKLEPEDRAHPDVITERIEILFGLERWGDALALIDGLLNAGDPNPELLLMAVRAARRSGDFVKTKTFLLRSIGPFNEAAMHHYWLAACEAQLGDLEAAKRHLTECFNRDRDMRATALQEPLLAPVWDSFAG